MIGRGPRGKQSTKADRGRFAPPGALPTRAAERHGFAIFCDRWTEIYERASYREART